MIPQLKDNLLALLILLQLVVQVFSHSSQSEESPQPLVFRYYIFSEQCFNSFVMDNNFRDIPCLKLVLPSPSRPSPNSSATQW